MVIVVGFAGIVFGGVIGYLVRDVVAYRPPSKRRRVVLDRYWRSWPATIQELRKMTSD